MVGLLATAVAVITGIGSPSAGEGAGSAATVVTSDGHPYVLSSSEVALVRARTSVSEGRLAEALRELDRVAIDSPDRPAADQLRIEVQQLLMASVRARSSSTLAEPVRR